MFIVYASPEFLVTTSAALLALVFDWVPQVRVWFDPLGQAVKRQVMGFLVIIATVLLYSWSCIQVFPFRPACTQVSLTDLFYYLLLALTVNQAIHLLVKPK